ncbi:MAG TPA: Arm DNA-binding domain-containing protein [Methylococcaceae bacterium]|nr:Arm DNA-binding domain-containing protein [Methylococcaceae bacterium]
MLFEPEIASLRPGTKAFKVADEQGLYLLVTPAGGKLWRFDYRFEGRQKTLAFGAYPDVSLTQAREKRDEARQLRADGIDPGEVAKERRAQSGMVADKAGHGPRLALLPDGIFEVRHGGRTIRFMEDDARQLHELLSKVFR